jgi:hypothetical protein
MAAQLGIGVRVRIGWAPMPMIGSLHDDPRFKTGVVFHGPQFLEPGAIRCGHLMIGGRYWGVQIDGGFFRHLMHERMLTPIDDDDPQAEDVDEELEVTA